MLPLNEKALPAYTENPNSSLLEEQKPDSAFWRCA
jgi:hypothetical protein